MNDDYQDLLRRLSEAEEQASDQTASLLVEAQAAIEQLWRGTRAVQARTAQRCDELRTIIEDVLQGGERFPPGARTGPQIRKFLKDKLVSFDSRHTDVN